MCEKLTSYDLEIVKVKVFTEIQKFIVFTQGRCAVARVIRDGLNRCLVILFTH